MATEEGLRSKALYKIELYMLKVLPMIMAAIYLAYTVLSYYDIDLPLLSYIGGMSVIPVIFMYVSSYVFRFCEYHRMFLHYIVASNLISIYDLYVGIPVCDLTLLMINLSVAGICLFMILYLYVKSNKQAAKKYSRQDRRGKHKLQS